MSDINTVNIRKHRAFNTHSIYIVDYFDAQIITTITARASIVESWLSNIYNIYHSHLSHLVIGLDTEWQRNSHIAILQLCVGRRCLIFQLMHLDDIPQMLIDFLADPNFSFVGVGVGQDGKKLMEDYGLRVEHIVELQSTAAEKLNDKALRMAGLKKLTSNVLGLEVEKPKRITMSRWDYQRLSLAQVQYACLDAYLSFQIGRKLIFGD